ncbi:MAG: hypothetical protein HC794_05530 [Nitrospiraceae bacterium]|nr:hypothetical protein [Nitrospiraceae bacterium]
MPFTMAIERMLEKQRITQTSATDQDVLGLARRGAAVDLQILFVRGGLADRTEGFLLAPIGGCLG